MKYLSLIHIYMCIRDRMWETWYKMSTMLQSGLNIDAVITHRFDIQDYEKGFAAMNSGQSGKVVLDWSSLQKEEK